MLWTRPAILTKSDIAREKERSRKRKWVTAGDAQYPYAAVEALRTRHKSFYSRHSAALKEMGIQAGEVEVHEAMRVMRINLFQNGTDSAWKACLPGTLSGTGSGAQGRCVRAAVAKLAAATGFIFSPRY